MQHTNQETTASGASTEALCVSLSFGPTDHVCLQDFQLYPQVAFSVGKSQGASQLFNLSHIHSTCKIQRN